MQGVSVTETKSLRRVVETVFQRHKCQSEAFTDQCTGLVFYLEALGSDFWIGHILKLHSGCCDKKAWVQKGWFKDLQ